MWTFPPTSSPTGRTCGEAATTSSPTKARCSSGPRSASTSTTAFSAVVGVWSDINDNVESEIGGDIQEIDVYAGIGYEPDSGPLRGLSFGLTYQEWYYAGDEERILDFSVAYDDSKWWETLGENFAGLALNPSAIFHYRLDGNGGQEEGLAIVLGIEPGYAFEQIEDYPITLSLPIGVGLFPDDDFQGGDDFYGYTYVGASAGMPLGFIPDDYGSWEVGANLTYYFTNDEAIPGNPDENFLTGSLQPQPELLTSHPSISIHTNCNCSSSKDHHVENHHHRHACCRKPPRFHPDDACRRAGV